MDYAGDFERLFEGRFGRQEKDGYFYAPGLGCDYMEIEFTDGEDSQRMCLLGDGLSCYYATVGLKIVEQILERMNKDKTRGTIVRRLVLGDGAELSDFDVGYPIDKGEA